MGYVPQEEDGYTSGTQCMCVGMYEYVYGYVWVCVRVYNVLYINMYVCS
jgi:hypothetical protein